MLVIGARRKDLPVLTHMQPRIDVHVHALGHVPETLVVSDARMAYGHGIDVLAIRITVKARRRITYCVIPPPFHQQKRHPNPAVGKRFTYDARNRQRSRWDSVCMLPHVHVHVIHLYT